MPAADFDDTLGEILGRDPSYAREAYGFVLEALQFTQRRLDRERHVTGEELLDGVRDLAREQFGFLAKTVFNAWGVRATDDFGAIVFNMVEAGLMGKQDTDTPDDFHERYDFAATFEEGFRLEPAAADDAADDGDDDESGLV